MKLTHSIGVVGATGAVGCKILRLLEEQGAEPRQLRLFASRRSVGQRIPFRNANIPVEDLQTSDFTGLDIVFFSAGTDISKEFCPKAVKAGAIVIDNSNAHRMDDNVPLVIPEVNPEDLAAHGGLIANPNCSTIQMLVAVAPIHRVNPVKRIVVSTYQSVSGTGQKAIDILHRQCKASLNGDPIPEGVYPHPIAFNVFPHIDIFLESGLCREEEKMIRETHKILGPDIKVCPTTVRLPVISCHSESLNLELSKPAAAEDIRNILAEAEGVVVMDDPARNIYPTPLACQNKDDVFVGRIRNDPTVENGINLWVVADNLRRGAATNAVFIYKQLVRDNLIAGTPQ